MRSEGDLPLDLVGTIYEAALQPSRWSEVLAHLQRLLNTSASILYHRELAARETSFVISHGFDQKLVDAYCDHFLLTDPNFLFRRTQPVGTVTASHQVLPDERYEQTEYYCDYLRHVGAYYTAGASLSLDGDTVSSVGVLRPKAGGPFDESEMARLRALVPHLQRAARIGQRLASRENERQSMLALLERLPTGVLLLDEGGRVAFLNRRAQAILAAGDGLTMTAQGIIAAAPDLQAVLARLIQEAVQTGAGKAAHAGGAMVLPSLSGSEPYELLVTPLRTGKVRMDVGPGRVCAAIFMHLRDAEPVLEPEVLRDLFGLTPAETRVTLALVRGRKLEEIAAEGNASRFTVRAQLSSVYEKIGVHRQAELVQRVLTSPAVLSRQADDRDD